ncbi:hypothetical protein JTB14_004503 [Gonioctena quinquepunctata]|nr:hypothetical protein JTB14_004503 [Gonioctena quinquepunctata]
MLTDKREYLATITSNFEKEKRSQISDYKGHDFEIHENIYKKISATQDILEIGPVLSFANGSTCNAKESLVDLSNLHSQHTYQNTPSTSTERSPTTSYSLKNPNSVPKYVPVQSSSDEDDIDLTYQPNQ